MERIDAGRIADAAAVERRRDRRDPLSRSLPMLSLFHAVIIGAMAGFFAHIKSDVIGTMERKLPSVLCLWDCRSVKCLCGLVVLGAISSSAAIAVNKKRLRRKDDRLRVNYFLLWAISILGITVIAVYLSSYFLSRLLLGFFNEWINVFPGAELFTRL